MTLFELIKKHGKPQALLDDWNCAENPKAIFDFEEIFMINNTGKPLLNGKIIDSDPLMVFQNTLNKWKGESKDLAAIGYISYDFKNLLFPHLNFKPINNDSPLLWFAKPKMIMDYENHNNMRDVKSINLKLIQDLPTPTEYEKFIIKIKSCLSIGDSYQINFTQPKKI